MLQNEKIDKFTGPVRQIDGEGVSMKRCVSVPSAVRLFYGAGCVKKRTVDGTDTQWMHGKYSVSESDAFDAQQRFYV